MQSPLPHKSQSQILSEKLKEIKKDVTSNDRQFVQNSLLISKATISKYLSGYVFDNDTALSILKCLKNKISNRNKIIENV